MKYGVREIAEVVLRAKGTTQIGNKIFFKDEPVMYFDTLKTSSFEGSSTTVYANGGRGNARLMAWDGEKTTTFTMEDALISPEGLMILTGAGLIQASESKVITQHITETVGLDKATIETAGLTIALSNDPKVSEDQDTIYVMLVKNGEIVSEPYIATRTAAKTVVVKKITSGRKINDGEEVGYDVATAITAGTFDSVIVDYYVDHTDEFVKQVNITPDSFGTNFYLEASTLFKNEDGIDCPAEFVIPNCKIQSNFSFSMAATGDPSTFTFTLDCFPDYTRWDKTEKVFAAIQIIPKSKSGSQFRTKTDAGDSIEEAEG